MAHDEITPLDRKQISIFRQITMADDSSLAAIGDS